MAFMDLYNFDVNRAKQCVIHYVTPDLKIIPFCAYNNVHRIRTEEKYALQRRKSSDIKTTRHRSVEKVFSKRNKKSVEG